jgi:hypothetical protein
MYQEFNGKKNLTKASLFAVIKYREHPVEMCWRYDLENILKRNAFIMDSKCFLRTGFFFMFPHCIKFTLKKYSVGPNLYFQMLTKRNWGSLEKGPIPGLEHGTHQVSLVLKST